MSSDLRFAQLPEPLDLPPESSEAADENCHRRLRPCGQLHPSISRRRSPGRPNWNQHRRRRHSAAVESEAAELLEGRRIGPGSQGSKVGGRVVWPGLRAPRRTRFGPSRSACRDIWSNWPPQPHRPATPKPSARTSTLDRLDRRGAKQAQARQMSAEVGKKQSEARRLRETKPQEARQAAAGHARSR